MCLRKKSAQIREILISESAWEEMTCLFAPSLVQLPEPFIIKNKEQEIAYNFCERMGKPKILLKSQKSAYAVQVKRLVKIIQTGMVTLGSVYLNLTHPIFGLGKQQRKAFHYNLMPI
jgi:hypothetical protein